MATFDNSKVTIQRFVEVYFCAPQMCNFTLKLYCAPKYFQSLRTGPSPEVAIIARVAAADARSRTAANNRLIMETTGLDHWTATPVEVREALRERENVMSDGDQEDATRYWVGHWKRGTDYSRVAWTPTKFNTIPRSSFMCLSILILRIGKSWHVRE